MPLKVCILLTNSNSKKEHPFSFYSKDPFMLLQSLHKDAGWHPLWICPSIPVWTVFYALGNFWHLCCSPSLSFAMSRYCRMETSRWGNNIFVIISALFHAVAFHWLVFQLPSQRRKAMRQFSSSFLQADNLWACPYSILKVPLSSGLSVEFKAIGFSHDALSNLLSYQTE